MVTFRSITKVFAAVPNSCPALLTHLGGGLLVSIEPFRYNKQNKSNNRETRVAPMKTKEHTGPFLRQAVAAGLLALAATLPAQADYSNTVMSLQPGRVLATE